MRKKIMLAIGILLALWVGIIVFAKPATCAWCPSWKCYGKYSCGSQCQCVTWGGEIGGTCVSVEYK